MKLLYFAWVRERIGLPEEDVDLPPTVVTIRDLVGWLSGRGEPYAQAFASPGVVRAAIDHMHAKPDTAIGDAREIALFPPMTGG